MSRVLTGRSTTGKISPAKPLTQEITSDNKCGQLMGQISLSTIPLGTCEKARPVNAGSHYLHYNLNDLNAEKSQLSGVLNPRQHAV